MKPSHQLTLIFILLGVLSLLVLAIIIYLAGAR
jgi:hypothetical protein